MSKIPLGQSYFPQDQKVSVYHVVFPVFQLSGEGKPISLIGSCFSVSSAGICITAAHLFQPFGDIKHERKKPEIMQKKLTYKYDDLRVGVMRFIGDKEKTTFRIDRINEVQIFLEHDLAILLLDNAKEFLNAPYLPIVETPKIGTDVNVLGYPGGANDWDEMQKEGHLALVDNPGTIIKSYAEKRDEGLAWFPCFECTAQMGPGHSGGPTIDKSIPAVVGINSNSGDSDGSVISWIGKALDEKIQMNGWECHSNDGEKTYLGEVSLRELSKIGLIKII